MKPFLFALVLLVVPGALFAGEPKEAEYLRQGAAYFEAKEYRRAVKAFGQAIQRNRGSAEAHRGLAMAYYRLGAGDAATDVEMLDKAVAEFKEALQLAPASDQTQYHLGHACLLLDDRQCAAQAQKALKELNTALAQQLSAAIAAHRAPGSFQTLVSLPEGKDQATTRVTLAGNSVLVPVTFSHRGKTAQATLILDTGASAIMITKELASRLELDLERAAPGAIMVADGRRVQVWRTKLERVAVGPKSRDGLDVVVVPENGGKFPFDGLLGMNFLRNFTYSVDFTNQVINWSR